MNTIHAVQYIRFDDSTVKTIVGITTGDSDEPGVVEDLADVIVWTDDKITARYPRYGDVAVANRTSKYEQVEVLASDSVEVEEYLAVRLAEAEQAVDQATFALSLARDEHDAIVALQRFGFAEAP